MNLGKIALRLGAATLTIVNIGSSAALLVYGDDEDSVALRTTLITVNLASQLGTLVVNCGLNTLNNAQHLITTFCEIPRFGLTIAQIACKATGVSDKTNAILGVVNSALGFWSSSAAVSGKESNDRSNPETKKDNPESKSDAPKEQAGQSNAQTTVDIPAHSAPLLIVSERSDVQGSYNPPTQEQVLPKNNQC